MKIFLYIKESKLSYFKNNQEGEIPLNKIEDFINENRGSIFYLIFSKLNCYFRKLEFNFRDRKKINLILGQEIEGKLPKPVDNFYFYFQFYYPEKDKTIVNAFAIEKEKVDFLKGLFEKNNAKHYFSIDSILFHQFFREIIKEKHYIEIFFEEEYLLVNLIENDEISAIYSYSSENIKKDNILEIILPLISAKKCSVYFIGKKNIYDELELPEIKFLSEINFSNILKEIKEIKKVSLTPINFIERKVPLNFIFSLIFLLSVTLFFIRPYFLRVEKEKKIEEINQKMENIYKSIFPETKRVINPLIQIKEKLGKNKNPLKVPVSDISIIKILEEIIVFFPENIKADVEEVVISGKNVSLTGTVDNLKNLDRIKENLKNSKIFKSFDVTSVSFTKENRVSFNLLLRMED
jgi:hypothetical protein